jgi:hypothetical protein
VTRRGRTVDDALGMQNGLVNNLRAPDELCAVLEGKKTRWYYERAQQVRVYRGRA